MTKNQSATLAYDTLSKVQLLIIEKMADYNIRLLESVNHKINTIQKKHFYENMLEKSVYFER
jgi:hypothetical protein